MTLRKLSRGEPVKVAHQDYNRWQDAGLANALGKLNQTGGLVLPDSQEGIILIENTLDRALPRYAVLGISGTIPDPRYSTQQSIEFQNQIALKGVLPSSTTSGKFCVLQTDAAPGEVVPAMVSGVTPVKINVIATSDPYADIETNTLVDQTKWLRSGGSGSAQILYAPTVTGEQWCDVRISNKPSTPGVEIVQVVHPGETVGEVMIANAGGVHPGYVATGEDHDLARGDACWILFVDSFDTVDGNQPAVNEDYYGPARLSGTYTVAADVRPLYVVRRGEVVDVVKVYHSGSAAGADVAANASGVHPGKVKRVINGVMTEPGDCWLLFVDDFDNEAGAIKAVNGDYYGPARLSGEFTHSAVTLPLYVARRNLERLVHFELTETLSLSGDAAAILLSDDDADWADTALAIQVYDWFASEGMWAGIAGYRGYALRREGVHASGRQKYDIVWMEQIAQTIQFTSTEYMGASTAGRMATTVNWYDHQGKDPGSTATVRDPQGQFPDVHSGAKGTAVYDYHNGYYRVVSSQRVALFATGSLTADSCGSSMSIDGFAVKQTGDYVGTPPTAPTAPANTCGHAGLDNDIVLLRRTDNAMPQPAWEVVDITKHSKTVMVDVQVTGLTFQKKELTIYAEVCTTTAPSWATWHTGGECP